jgi:autotransporter-associated beta strand protein
VNIASGATLSISDSQETIGTLAGSGSVNLGSANLVLAAPNTSSTFAGVISDTSSGGSLTKDGSGTLELSGASTYGGGTSIDGGKISLGNNSALGSSSAPLSVSGALLNLNGFDLTVGGLNGNGSNAIITDDSQGPGISKLIVNVPNGDTDTYSGTICDGTGGRKLSLEVGGGAGAYLVLAGDDTYTGGTIVDANTGLSVGRNSLGSIVGNVTVEMNGCLWIASTENLTLSGNIVLGSGSNLTHNWPNTTLGTLTLSGIISGTGRVIQNSPGAMTLSGNSCNTGGFTVGGGELDLESGAVLSPYICPVTMINGTLGFLSNCPVYEPIFVNAGTTGYVNTNGYTVFVVGPLIGGAKLDVVGGGKAVFVNPNGFSGLESTDGTAYDASPVVVAANSTYNTAWDGQDVYVAPDVTLDVPVTAAPARLFVDGGTLAGGADDAAITLVHNGAVYSPVGGAGQLVFTGNSSVYGNQAGVTNLLLAYCTLNCDVSAEGFPNAIVKLVNSTMNLDVGFNSFVVAGLHGDANSVIDSVTPAGVILEINNSLSRVQAPVYAGTIEDNPSDPLTVDINSGSQEFTGENTYSSDITVGAWPN